MSEVMNVLGDECRGDECRTIIKDQPPQLWVISFYGLALERLPDKTFFSTIVIFQRFLLTAFISILCSLSLLFKVRVGPPGASGPPDNWHFLRTRRPDFLNRHASVSLAKSQSSEYMSMLVPIFLSLYYPSIHVKYLDPTALLI